MKTIFVIFIMYRKSDNKQILVSQNTRLQNVANFSTIFFAE